MIPTTIMGSVFHRMPQNCIQGRLQGCLQGGNEIIFSEHCPAFRICFLDKLRVSPYTFTFYNKFVTFHIVGRIT